MSVDIVSWRFMHSLHEIIDLTLDHRSSRLRHEHRDDDHQPSKARSMILCRLVMQRHETVFHTSAPCASDRVESMV